MAEDLIALAAVWRAWHTEHFRLGTDGEPFAIQLLKEAREFRDKPSLREGSDVFICLLGWLDAEGHSIDDFLAALKDKIDENMRRSWEPQPDGTFRHVPEKSEGDERS